MLWTRRIAITVVVINKIIFSFVNNYCDSFKQKEDDNKSDYLKRSCPSSSSSRFGNEDDAFVVLWLRMPCVNASCCGGCPINK